MAVKNIDSGQGRQTRQTRRKDDKQGRNDNGTDRQASLAGSWAGQDLGSLGWFGGSFLSHVVVRLISTCWLKAPWLKRLEKEKCESLENDMLLAEEHS